MALIKNQTLGDVTGRIRNVVYKIRGPVKYISPIPKKYPMPQDPNSVHNRNQLFLISKLAGLINAVDLIKMIWKMEYPDCYSTYHEIIISNYPGYKYEDLRGNLVLTPKTGFPVTNPSFKIENEKLILSADPLSADSGIDLSTEKYITSATIFLLNSDISPFIGPGFNSRKGNKVSPDFNHSLQITTNLAVDAVLCSLPDSLVKLWSVLITLDENNNPVRYSEVITWPPDLRSFLNDDDPKKYMKNLQFPERKIPGNRWNA